MKKIFAILALAAFTSVGFAQMSHQQRVEQRQARQQAYVQQLTKAVANKNFTFTAQTYTPNFGSQMPVTGIDNYVDIHPSYVDVNLPYVSFAPNIPTPQALFFSAPTYIYQVNVVKDRAYVQITLNNVQNMGQALNVPQNFSFTINMEIILSNGAATMTVQPSFNSSITYSGVIAIN